MDLASILIVAPRQSAFVLLGCLDCHVCRWPSASAFSLEGFTPSIALDIHLHDSGVVHEAVDGRERHGRIGEDLAPLSERLVRRDQHGTPLVARRDQLEQDAGLGLIFGDIRQHRNHTTTLVGHVKSPVFRGVRLRPRDEG